ncbi:hypothetical protein QZH41_008452 [Actinostola sp. cb2023]|nr:hypothetical protein QZH41_008452 [Actinostola sp. cb2023]
MEASRVGLTLVEDPIGSRNQCLYRCVGKFLGLQANDVVDMVEGFMIPNQIVENVNEDGPVEKQDLFLFLANTDFPSLRERPNSWKTSVLALRNEMANHVVVRSTASLFSLNLNNIDWRGVS